MDPRISFLISHLKQEICSSHSADSIAGLVNLSPSRVAHLFRRDVNVSPRQFSKVLRMQQARFLLETSFLSVKEIMAKCGFSDASHFVRDFKRVYGVSPTAYRSQMHCNRPRNSRIGQ